MTGHGAWDELAAGYAVGALEPEEEHAFLDHLPGCDRCRQTLAELADVTGQLAHAPAPAEPPGDLRGRILDAAAAERPAVFGAEPPVALFPRSAPARAAARRPRVRASTLVTAAAAVVAFGLAVWTFELRGDNRAQQLALERRTEALACLAAPDARSFALTSDSGQRATACLAGGRAYVVADRIERNDTAGSVYVLWWMDEAEGLHAVERFDVETSGTSVFELPLDVPPEDVRAMAISLEPGRGLPEKPTKPVASGAATAT
jgi:anti-sigma-K factor RskA